MPSDREQSPVYEEEANRLKILCLGFENQVQYLRLMSDFDLKVCSGYITLQLAIAGWLATKPLKQLSLQLGIMLIDMTLANGKLAMAARPQGHREQPDEVRGRERPTDPSRRRRPDLRPISPRNESSCRVKCSLITEVLSLALRLKDFDLILVLGRYASCGSVGLNAANIPLVQGVERSVSVLPQERPIQTEVPGDLPSTAPRTGVVHRLGPEASDKKTLASIPDKDLLVLFRQAQGCIAAQLNGSKRLPEPATSRAQMDLAVEGVSRLTGFRPPNN